MSFYSQRKGQTLTRPVVFRNMTKRVHLHVRKDSDHPGTPPLFTGRELLSDLAWQFFLMN